MEYFRIADMDVSPYVSGLKVSRAANFSSQTNAAGNTVVDFINSKRTIEVTIIPLDNETIVDGILERIKNFNLTITYRKPGNGELEQVNVMIPNDEIDYYTIQAAKVMYKAFNLTFIEL